MKTRVWAIAVASSLLSSTAMIGAEGRESTAAVPTVASQEHFRASITRATATLPLASGSVQEARSSQDQDPPDGRRRRTSTSCSCGIPSWMKYSLLAAAGVGGGYAISQLDHHGRHGGFDRDPMPAR